MESISIPAGRLAFDARLAGPEGGRPVLLLHGFPQTSWSFRFQLAALAQAGYRALAPDQRGYSSGARPTEVSDYRVAHLVEDAMAFADWLGVEKIDLVGHDWGGAVAWAVAARHPERIRTLTVVSTPHPLAFAQALGSNETDQSDRSSYMQFFAQPEIPEQTLLSDEGAGLRAMFVQSGFGAKNGDDAEADEIAVYIEAMLQPGAMTGALNWYRAVSAEDMGGVGRIAVPTMYVWSTEDVALGREAAEDTANYVDGPYRFEVLEGISHWIPEQASGELSRLLLEHLGSH